MRWWTRSAITTFELTSGQDHDSVTGYRFLQELDYYPSEVLADRAYDTNAILELLQSRAITAVIPSKRNRQVKRLLDSETYKEHHLIECIFNKVKKTIDVWPLAMKKNSEHVHSFFDAAFHSFMAQIGLRTDPSKEIQIEKIIFN